MPRATLPPELQFVLVGFRQLAGKVVAAGTAKALEEVGRLTGEIDRRVKRGAHQAQRMADGEPYDPEEPEEPTRGRRR